MCRLRQMSTQESWAQAAARQAVPNWQQESRVHSVVRAYYCLVATANVSDRLAPPAAPPQNLVSSSTTCTSFYNSKFKHAGMAKSARLKKCGPQSPALRQHHDAPTMMHASTWPRLLLPRTPAKILGTQLSCIGKGKPGKQGKLSFSGLHHLLSAPRQSTGRKLVNGGPAGRAGPRQQSSAEPPECSAEPPISAAVSALLPLQRDHDTAGPSPVPVLVKVYSLPRAQRQPPLGDRDREACPHQ